MASSILIKNHKRGYRYLIKENQTKIKSCRVEDDEQIQFVIDFKHKYPGLANKLLHIPNEVRASDPQYHIKAEKKGKVKGASDILLFISNGENNLLALEFKRETIKHSSKVSDEQISFLDMIISTGGKGVVVYGCDAAMLAVELFMENKL